MYTNLKFTLGSVRLTLARGRSSNGTCGSLGSLCKTVPLVDDRAMGIANCVSLAPPIPPREVRTKARSLKSDHSAHDEDRNIRVTGQIACV